MDSTSSPRRVRLGVIVPSSNTALEPLTQQMILSLAQEGIEASLHFARFRVTKIELSDDSNSQFTLESMLEAAGLLADAKVDIIGWSGTSASWLGFSSDDTLCQMIKNTTGIPATSSVLAMRDILLHGVAPEIGLVTPYITEVNAAICDNFAKEGLSIAGTRSQCSGLTTNFDFAAVQEQELDEMVSKVVTNGARVILIMCTNLSAAQRVIFWERKYSVTVLDSVATVLHGMLRQLGIETSSLASEWGSLFNIGTEPVHDT
ncbi:maleate isomerase [Fusarium tjaetaba]|uniref:Maleate isomerase n=1 Tax=Fusarium tjaetaba TaxID=1567544 RepID=A0A8H5VIS1_9HYPO|nr:maleate isomerase [Fusarium tjaetaba]KAF5626312.1 maleate isomerase [Fusarium tjaetaba]